MICKDFVILQTLNPYTRYALLSGKVILKLGLNYNW